MFLKGKLLTDCWSCRRCYKTSILAKVRRDCRLNTCRKWHLVINAYFHDFYQIICYYNLLSYILMLFPTTWMMTQDTKLWRLNMLVFLIEQNTGILFSTEMLHLERDQAWVSTISSKIYNLKLAISLYNITSAFFGIKILSRWTNKTTW